MGRHEHVATRLVHRTCSGRLRSHLHRKERTQKTQCFIRSFYPASRVRVSSSQEGHLCVFGETATEDVTMVFRSLYVKLTKLAFLILALVWNISVLHHKITVHPARVQEGLQSKYPFVLGELTHPVLLFVVGIRDREGE